MFANVRIRKYVCSYAFSGNYKGDIDLTIHFVVTSDVVPTCHSFYMPSVSFQR